MTNSGKQFFFVIRYNELLFRSHELLIRSHESLIRSHELLSRDDELLFRYNEIEKKSCYVLYGLSHPCGPIRT